MRDRSFESDHGSHRIEKVREHYGKAHEQRRRQTQLGKKPKIHSTEDCSRTPQTLRETENFLWDHSGSAKRLTMTPHPVGENRNAGRQQDPPQQRPFNPPHQHPDGKYESQDKDCYRYSLDTPQPDQRLLSTHYQTAIHQTDQRDEETDARSNRSLQRQRRETSEAAIVTLELRETENVTTQIVEATGRHALIQSEDTR